MKEGGYDQKVNETVTVVTTKGSEIGQKTWGIMKGVMAMASQKVEEYTKEGGGGGGSGAWKTDSWQWSENNNNNNGNYHEFRKETNSSPTNYNSTGSWDDWDDKGKKEVSSGKDSQIDDGWAGWDDNKDDGYNNHYSSSNMKAGGQNGKSDISWSEGGFL